MISLQSHNQVLYHLTQLSAVNPRSIPFAIKSGKRSAAVAEKVNILCQESLAEAAENCKKLPVVKLNVCNANTFKLKKNNVYIMLDRRSNVASRKSFHKAALQKTSYASRLGSIENEQDVPYLQLADPVALPMIHLSCKEQNKLLHILSTKMLYNYNMQVRGFKTQNSIKLKADKHLVASSKLKKWFGLSPNLTLGSKSVTNEAENKMKYLYNDEEVSTSDRLRIKAAFAEGYEAGLHRQKPERSLFGKLLLITICGTVFLASIWAVVKTTGSMFRISFASSNVVNPEEIHVTFNDVKGVEEAKQELNDIVEFLKNPDKYSALGGKLPKGVLLIGPPGTGKTLLARAVAGEAGVPFFHAAGPEFDEVLVGQGARRMRELFKAAKDRAPCVVFIDEIDSVGSKRTSSILHPYANQTINQLLTEMDGFHQNNGIIVLGATNRYDDLDKALVRPGRFDIQVPINYPDYYGRKEILDHYLSRVLARDIDTAAFARCLMGFNGAHIENMVNQAALRAAMEGADFVTTSHLEYAREKIILGPPGKIKVQNEEDLRITAFHESGHALVAYYTKNSPSLYKVSILPHGHVKGRTVLTSEVNEQKNKSQLMAMMDIKMGGRVAEELIFGSDKVTPGAVNDFQDATHLAESMVKEFGMSKKVGVRYYKQHDPENKEKYSQNTITVIDDEIKRLLEESYERAKNLLNEHIEGLKALAEALVKYETLDDEEVKAILSGKKAEIPKGKKTLLDMSKNIL